MYRYLAKKVTENYLPNQAIVKQLANSQFTTEYWDHESQKDIPYECPDDEETPGSGLCIFHDENYLKEDKYDREEREQKVRDRLIAKVNHSISYNEALHCIGYHLPDITIKEANFIKSIDFTNCKFQRVDFESAEFSEAIFYSAEFSREAYFRSAKFEKANFRSAIFSGPADVREAIFSAESNFFDAKFHGKADFSEAKFLEVTNFMSAKFFEYQEVDFSHTEFIKRAYFRFANFLGTSTFCDIYFHSRVTFLGVEFNDVSFSDIIFQGKTTFNYARLYKAEFRSIEFKGRALFEKANFLGNIDFINTTFEQAIFSESIFSKETKFNYVVFGGGEKTFFDVSDLSKVSFANTDIRRKSLR